MAMFQTSVDSSTLQLNLSQITLDPEIQPRQQLNQEVVTEYAEAMSQGATFPPIIVFYDGGNYWLADGFHRVQAKQVIGGDKILAEVIFGARRDALLYAVGANTTHGLTLCKSDKRKFFSNILYEDKKNTLISPSKPRNHQKRSRKVQRNETKHQSHLLNKS